MVTTLLGVGGVAGAVYSPLVSIVPTIEFPLCTPLTCQFTRVLLRFEMVAVNCTVSFAFTEVLLPETDIIGLEVEELLPQEFSADSTAKSAKTAKKRCHRASRRHPYVFG
jgi:hypothetical protein